MTTRKERSESIAVGLGDTANLNDLVASAKTVSRHTLNIVPRHDGDGPLPSVHHGAEVSAAFFRPKRSLVAVPQDMTLVAGFPFPASFEDDDAAVLPRNGNGPPYTRSARKMTTSTVTSFESLKRNCSQRSLGHSGRDI